MSTISSLLFPPCPSLPILPPFRSSPKPFLKPYSSLSLSKPHNLLLSPLLVAADHSDTAAATTIAVDNDQSADSTAFIVRARNRIGLLQVITKVFKLLGLRIDRASVEFEGDFFVKMFFVADSNGRKIEKKEDLNRIERAIRDAIEGSEGEGLVGAGARTGSRGIVVRRPGLGLEFGERKAKAERMFALMDGFLKNDPVSLQKDILDHVEYTVARSRFSFDDFEAYQALSHSVRDRLIERWHDTHQYFKRKDPKRLYFLSMEFLMGRSLSNSVINLGIRDQYADALNQLGFEFEVLAEQKKW